jgi:hypothetical protein
MTMNLLSCSPRTLSDLLTRKNRLPIGEFQHLVAESHNDSGALQMKIFTVDRPEARTLRSLESKRRSMIKQRALHLGTAFGRDCRYIAA